MNYDFYKNYPSCCAMEVLREWLMYMEKQKKYSHHTLECYTRDVLSFFRFISLHRNKNLSEINMVDIKLAEFRSYCADRRRNNLQSRSIARAIAALRGYFQYGEKKQKFKNNNINLLRLPKLPHNLPKPVSVDKALKIPDMVVKARQNKPQWVINRDYSLVLMLYASGMRISEALSLTYQDYLLLKQQNAVKVVGKGKKNRIIPILPKVKHALGDYVKNCPYDFNKTKKLFFGEKGGELSPRIIQLLMQDLRSYMGFETNFTPHSLRHSFATHMLANGCDLRSIQEILGHESLATTQNYTEVADNQLLEIYRKNHPRS